MHRFNKWANASLLTQKVSALNESLHVTNTREADARVAAGTENPHHRGRGRPWGYRSVNLAERDASPGGGRRGRRRCCSRSRRWRWSRRQRESGRWSGRRWQRPQASHAHALARWHTHWANVLDMEATQAWAGRISGVVLSATWCRAAVPCSVRRAPLLLWQIHD